MSIAKKFEVIADEVYEKGKKDEHGKFWDAYQENGTRKNYERAFEGRNFTFDNFYPKYDLVLEGMNPYVLYNWRTARTTFKSGSLKQRLEECGVKLDTSKATNLSWAFGYNCFTELPTIDLTGLAEVPTACFGYGYEHLKTIEKIIIAENTPLVTNMFAGATGLENLIIEGTIGQNNFNVKDCTKLTVASLLSILTALSKDQSIASGKSITFSTVHKSVIEADADCLEQYNLALNAGWEILFA